jgi:hypothetical protein
MPQLTSGPARGERHHAAKLTEGRVRQARALRARDRLSYAEIGLRLGVSRETARLAVIGRTWSHVEDVK